MESSKSDTKKQSQRTNYQYSNISPHARSKVPAKNGHMENNYIEREKYYYDSCDSDFTNMRKSRSDVLVVESRLENTSKSQTGSQSYSHSEDESDKLPEEIYQIIKEVYSAHMNNEDISHNVAQYSQNVKDYCSKVNRDEIIIFIKLFAEKVNYRMKVMSVYS